MEDDLNCLAKSGQAFLCKSGAFPGSVSSQDEHVKATVAAVVFKPFMLLPKLGWAELSIWSSNQQRFSQLLDKTLQEIALSLMLTVLLHSVL